MVKKILITLASMVGLVLLAALVYFFFLPVFDMAGSLPEFPETIQVYKLIKPVVTEETVTALGTKLGMTGEVGSNKLFFTINDQETGKTLTVTKTSGAFQYNIGSKQYPDFIPNLPSYEQAADIAIGFLADLGYLFEGVKVKEVVPGGAMGDTVTHLLVRFIYPVGGYQFAANKYGVRIGDGGEVVGAFIDAVQYEPYKTVPLKPVKQAYRELKKTGKQFTGVRGLWVSIDSVSVEYWLEGVNRDQEYLYPVYSFNGESRPGHDNFTGYVEATDESSIDFPTIN